jgi:hypothetical protein
MAEEKLDETGHPVKEVKGNVVTLVAAQSGASLRSADTEVSRVG